MELDGQLILVVVLVGLAGSYLLFRAYRAMRRLGRGACGSGCGCGSSARESKPELIGDDELTARLRRQ
jgi:hypothetical protein